MDFEKLNSAYNLINKIRNQKGNENMNSIEMN